MNFRISLSTSSGVGSLMRIILNLQINSRSTAILTVLSLPIIEHGLFSIYVDLFVFFSTMFYSFQNISFALLLYLFEYFIFIVLWVKLFSFIFGLFIEAYRNTVDFYILILYSETLQNMFISSNSCFVDSSGFSLYKDHIWD